MGRAPGFKVGSQVLSAVQTEQPSPPSLYAHYTYTQSPDSTTRFNKGGGCNNGVVLNSYENLKKILDYLSLNRQPMVVSRGAEVKKHSSDTDNNF